MRSKFFGCPTAQDGSKLDRGIIFLKFHQTLNHYTFRTGKSHAKTKGAHTRENATRYSRMAVNCQISKNGETNARVAFETSSLHVQFALAAHWLNACNSTGSLSAYSDITRTERTHARPSLPLCSAQRFRLAPSLFTGRKTVSYLSGYFQ